MPLPLKRWNETSPPAALHFVLSIQLLYSRLLRLHFIIRYTQWHMAMINKTVRTVQWTGVKRFILSVLLKEKSPLPPTLFHEKWHLCANVVCIFSVCRAGLEVATLERIRARFWGRYGWPERARDKLRILYKISIWLSFCKILLALSLFDENRMEN